MPAFLARRLLAAVPVLLGVALLVFLALRLAPGDPAVLLAGDAASEAQVAEVRARLGLERPLVLQFLSWLASVVHGELGYSYYYQCPVGELLLQRLEPTCSLALLTVTLATLVALPLGVAAAARSGGRAAAALQTVSVLGTAVPVFLAAYLLVGVFSLWLGWLPVQGYHRLADGALAWLQHMLLPAGALVVTQVALLARVTRASVAAALRHDSARTARAKGLARSAVLLRHVVPNAAVPILTTGGTALATLLGGVVATESVFAIPGLGRLTIDAVLARDFPTVQALVLACAVIYVLLNLAVDLACAWIDPRAGVTDAAG